MTGDTEMVRLRAPPGTDEANVGTQRFVVDQHNGTITVPHDIAVVLENSHAEFVEADPAPVPQPNGTLTVRARPGTSANWHGMSYSVDENGLVTVPAAAWPALSSHGFRIA